MITQIKQKHLQISLPMFDTTHICLLYATLSMCSDTINNNIIAMAFILVH